MQTRKEDRRSCHNASFIIGLLVAARDQGCLQTANSMYAVMLQCVTSMVHHNEMRWN